MKKLLVLHLLASSMLLQAAGVKGRVVSKNGCGKKGVTVHVVEHNVTTTTDDYGNYFLELPSSSQGLRITVKVDGKKVATPTVPVKGHATVDVKLGK